MDLILILALGLAIGAVLGSLGGGGAVLTVPALVYVLGQTAQDATTSSLLIVGLSALVGVLGYISAQRVCWRLGLGFALAGIPAAWAGTYANHRVDPNLLLLGFSIVMTVAAAALVADLARSTRSTRLTSGATAPPAPARKNHGPEPTSGSLLVDEQTRVQAETVTPHNSMLPVVVTGLLVGLLTGFFGVGGGFVIVPVLVLVLRLPMQQAVGTSLLIVALNSATSLGAPHGRASRA